MFRLVAFLCVLFVALTGVAMVLYSGGTAFDHECSGYSFCSNFLSDLGRTRTHGGQPNASCMSLFIIAVISQAVSLAVFFAGFRRFFHERPLARRLSQAAYAFALLSAVCFVGVAVTPWDLVVEWHVGFLIPAFGFLFGAALLTIAAITIEGGFPALFNQILITFAVIVCAYIALLLAGPSLDTPRGLWVQVTAQKVTVLAAEAAFFALSMKALRFSHPQV